MSTAHGLTGKRILFISYNGVEEPVFQSQGLPYLRGLQGLGHRVHLLSYEKNKTILADLARTLKEEGIFWKPLRYHKRPRWPATLLDLICGWVLVLYLGKRKAIDILHARSLQPALIAFVGSRCLSLPFLYDMRGLLNEEYAEGGLIRRGSLGHRFMKSLEIFCAKRAEHVVVLTERMAELVRSWRKGKQRQSVSVIPCSVDLKRFSVDSGAVRARDLPPNTFLWVYAGSLGSWYGTKELIDFFLCTKTFIPRGHLLLLSKADRNALIPKFFQWGLAPSDVTFRSVSHDEVPAYLAHCQAGLVFYRNRISNIGTSPIKLAEYLASGLPVVINRGVGDTEMLVETHRIGVILQEFKRESYEQAAREMADLIGEGAALKERCRKAAEAWYCLERAIASYEEIYRHLGANGKRECNAA